MRKCIIAPDSFKGSLSASQVCDVVAEVFAARMPDCVLINIPVADGGEGTVDCFARAVPGCVRTELVVSGPFREPCRVHYISKDATAIVEMALCAGLPLVEGRANPLLTTTCGVGEIIKHAVHAGCRHIVLGLGGSCTNDGGAGMAAALGAVFRDQAGRAFVPTGGTLSEVVDYDISAVSECLKGVGITAMCDIDSPMHGPEGAAYVFAPQKGASEADVRVLDAGLKSMDAVIARVRGARVGGIPGTGAAGAMGAGVIAFLGGKLKPGIDTVLDAVDFDEKLDGADLVITGEGRVDLQSVKGKVVSGVARRAKARGVPVLVLAGAIEPGAETLYGLGVSAMFSINRKCETFDVARPKAKENLRVTVENLMRLWLAAEKGH